jgi:outer membrane protein insertion porin family
VLDGRPHLTHTQLFADSAGRPAERRPCGRDRRKPISTGGGNGAVSGDKLREEVTLKPRGIYTRARIQEDVGKIVELYRLSESRPPSPKIVQLDKPSTWCSINEGPTACGPSPSEQQRSDLREVMVTQQSALVPSVHDQ